MSSSLDLSPPCSLLQKWEIVFTRALRDRLVDAHIRVNIYIYRTKRLTEEPCA
jgi:hypothetical protein